MISELLRRISLRKTEYQNAINMMIKFVQGELHVSDFWNSFCEKPVFIDMLKKFDKDMNSFRMYYENQESAKKVSLDSMKTRIHIYWMIKHFLTKINIDCNPYNIEEGDYLFLSEIQPLWLDIQDDAFIQSIIKSIPENFSSSQKKSFAKKRINEMFLFENRPPKWMQNPDWPIVDGIPLIFVKQDGDPDNVALSNFQDRINYTFKNPISGEYIVVEQFD